MSNWDEGDPDCRADADRRDAVRVAGTLGLRLHQLDFSVEYREQVFAHFLDELAAGRTPNPDIACNREIKFGALLEKSRALGADRLATGHYARVVENERGFSLKRGHDHRKDQSYFLHQLDQQQLCRAEFPLGELEKSQVRERAQSLGLSVATKRDSTGICFIGERNFANFVGAWLKPKPGLIRAAGDQQVLGEHSGTHLYTLGQRGGLGLGGVAGTLQAPWYVVGKNLPDNVIYVDQNPMSAYLLSRTLDIAAMHWIAGSPPAIDDGLTAQLRHLGEAVSCTLDTGPLGWRVRLGQAQRAAVPGQSMVLYRGDECLGGGPIDATDAPPVGAPQ